MDFGVGSEAQLSAPDMVISSILRIRFGPAVCLEGVARPPRIALTMLNWLQVAKNPSVIGLSD